MTVKELAELLKDLMADEENNNIEVVYDDSIGTLKINRARICSLWDDDDDEYGPDDYGLVLSK